MLSSPWFFIIKSCNKDNPNPLVGFVSDAAVECPSLDAHSIAFEASRFSFKNY